MAYSWGYEKSSATKDLEGNPDLQDGAQKASHGVLLEILPVLDHILDHFESLQTKAHAGEFDNNLRIQSCITLAWNKAMSTAKWRIYQ